MMTVTESAARALRRMTNTDLYPRAGLRIRKVSDNHFSLSIVPALADSDITVPGVNVYLDRPAAAALDDVRLDAGVNADLASQLMLGRAH